MHTAHQLTEQITALYEHRSMLYARLSGIYPKILHTGYSQVQDTAYREEIAAVNAEIETLGTTLERLQAERVEAYEYEQQQFVRPTQGFVGLLSRPLGALPNRSVLINPTRENIAQVRPQRLLAILTLAGAVIALITLSSTVPWLRISPYSVLYGVASNYIGEWADWGSIAAAVLLSAVLSHGFIRHQYTGKLFEQYAAQEEQWFRTGAERWTNGQRLYSCVSFGCMHVINVIYPLSSLIVLSGVGAVFMLAYLRAYRRTGSTELATLTSIRLHATYNRFGIVYIVAALSITWYATTR